MFVNYTECNVENLFERVEKIDMYVENSVESVENYPIYLKIMVKYFSTEIKIWINYKLFNNNLYFC